MVRSFCLTSLSLSLSLSKAKKNCIQFFLNEIAIGVEILSEIYLLEVKLKPKLPATNN